MKSHVDRAATRADVFGYVRPSNPRLRAFAGASASVLAAFLASGVAHAQSAAPAASNAASGTPSSVGEVVVTGSRIAKKDFQANSPIVTVTSQNFQQNADVAVEATLNQLPEFTPDQSELGALQTGAIQPTAIATPGIATASLRGLGANRNLVLVDGRRMTPVNGLNVVDLNTIPSAMIDHVETITGGASAVYGADAMSGVVNFILKKNFQGIDVDTQYTATQHGGGEEFKASVLMGTNFADDKGNVTIGFEHYTRAVIDEQSRQFYVNGEQDPTVGPNGLFQMTGAYYAPSAATGGCASATAYATDFGAPPTGAALFGDTTGLCALGGAIAAGVYFNPNGSVY
ncbi:MAG TPA: TonB-dependent receptor plug domain-containing protein, partial [Caulobacteraceae bacterium]|nr:TonB-dependent receptor plug domain-containing protein [Caulobacteraceae bacterium]